MNFLSFDVETTGFLPNKDPILSIGVTLWNPEWDKQDEFYRLLDWTRIPGYKLNIPESSTKVHGITVETLQNDDHAVHPVEAFVELYDWIHMFVDGKEDRSIGVINAFNSSFDVNFVRAFLKWACERYQLEGNPGGGVDDGSIRLSSDDVEHLNQLLAVFTKRDGSRLLFVDSMTLDIILHFEDDGVKQMHNLEDVGQRYGLGANELAHNAMYDTRRLLDVLKCQVNELEQLGIPLDQKLEDRIVRKYDRNQKRFRDKGDNMRDYFGLKVSAFDPGV